LAIRKTAFFGLVFVLQILPIFFAIEIVYGGRGARSSNRLMNWFRFRGRPLARLALFALVLQMAASFGHLHRDELGLSPRSFGTQFGVANVTSALAAPAPHDHYPSTDDYCPICATAALVAAAVPSLPPVLLIPLRAGCACQPPMGTRSLSSNVAHSFQARAPPIA
jgi:hypothetical protein